MKINLAQEFGNIDIYLFDQLLKGTYDACEYILDVGCGEGRNLHYFLRHGAKVYGIDIDPEKIVAVKALSKVLASRNKVTNFQTGMAEDLPYPDSKFDLVISSAVLHFASDINHFEAMLSSMWRVLKPGGYFFARLASDIGIETKVAPIGQGRYLLPDDSERFLVNEQMLLEATIAMNGILLEPIKTTNVQNLRCMTTWCLQKI